MAHALVVVSLTGPEEQRVALTGTLAQVLKDAEAFVNECVDWMDADKRLVEVQISWYPTPW